MSPPRHHSPLTAYLTLDTLIALLWLPLPVAWSLPLISLATSQSYSSPSLPYTFAIAIFYTILQLLNSVNQRLAFGGARILDWSQEVVVVTGGASGLGRSIAEIFGMRGASVAILDIKEVDGGVETLGEGVKWWRCDVGSFEAVASIKAKIEKDVCRFSYLYSISHTSLEQTTSYLNHNHPQAREVLY